MSNSHLVSPPPEGLFRTARFREVADFPDPPEPLSLLERVHSDGRRWDDPHGLVGTMYAATTPAAAFGDSIARYRRRMLANGVSVMEHITDSLRKPDPGEPDTTEGEIPAEYFEDWVMVQFHIHPHLKFVDLSHQATLKTLNFVIADRVLPPFGEKRFSRANLTCGVNRAITRAVARFYYDLSGTPDHENIVGLRFDDCRHSDWEYWALWADQVPDPRARGTAIAIEREDPDLIMAADRLGITMPPA